MGMHWFSQMSKGIKFSSKAYVCVTFCSAVCYCAYQGAYSVLVGEVRVGTNANAASYSKQVTVKTCWHVT